MNIQQFASWKNAHPTYKKSVLHQKKLKLKALTQLIASMEKNL